MDLFEFARQKELIKETDPQDAIYTVSEITADVKNLIKTKFGQQGFWIKGEISNFKGRNQSGHIYFRLKDSGAVLNCVFFRNLNRKLRFDLKEGLEVLAFGRLDVWELGGSYQLVVEEVRAGGTGELYLRFEQLKKKLEAEGLFEADRKKALPEFPQRVGVVTSPTGAVIRDIIHVTRSRYPFIMILLIPVKVQGEGAAQEIASAVAELNQPEHRIDVMVVGRGGGSIEDLWPFNEEIVARAIAVSEVPVVSAVGHQTDFTIADFVADRRAATPSHAGEMIVPNMMDLKRRVDLIMKNIVQELIHSRDLARRQLETLIRSPVLRDPTVLIRSRIQQVDLAIERLLERMKRKREREAEHVKRTREFLHWIVSKIVPPRRLLFEKISSNLSLLNPLSILSRGYSVVRKKDQRIVKSSNQVKKDEQVFVHLYKGELTCQVKKISQT